MTDRPARVWFIVAALLLFAYAAFFPLLTVDTVLFALGRAASVESRTLYLLLFLELSRLLTTVAALAVVIALLARGVDRADARALVLFLLFAVIGYEKVLSSNGYPGPLQEHIARSLLHAGISRPVLRWVFGAIVWPLWPAAAALLRFSAVFPRPLELATLDASARLDRRGFMRSSALAGADIGAFFRAVSRAIMQRRGYSPVVLAVAAAALIVLHTVLPESVVRIAAYVVAFLVVCIVATNLRAAYLSAQGHDRVRATWIAEGFVLALFMFLVSAAVLLLVPTSIARMAAFILIMLTPAAIIICLAASVLARGEQDSGNALEHTVRDGTTVLAVILTFGMLFWLFGLVTQTLGMPRAVAGIAALIAAVLAFGPVRRTAERARLRVLERQG